ncbi:hypothetical protein P2318_16715 [Myxococcaceae bacterium GXIMD 01537]
MHRLLVVLIAALGTGCASHTALAPDDRNTLKHSLTGPEAAQYLRMSLNVTPFFGDATRRLVTPYAPDEVRMLDDTQGNPINPGPVQAVLPAGSRVRIADVEFPTAWVVAERIVYTPRTHPWVTLSVEGAPAGQPLVLVLPRPFKTPEEFRAELQRYLTERDPAPKLAAFSEPVREAIRQKRAVAGMTEEALELSWGPPERILRNVEGGGREEEWSYPGGRRRAFLTEGRVTRVEQGEEKP